MQQQRDSLVDDVRQIGDEFEFTDDDFHRICGLIQSRAGIRLGHNKRAMVYSRLGRRLRKLNIASFKEYLDCMESGTGEEFAAFINALTTNLTYFYRETHHFSVLRSFLESGGLPRGATIWSAGCSTGEEAYSIAMVLATVRGLRPQNGQVVASDIDTSVLEHAERGVYTEERVKNVPPADLKRFFLGGMGDNAGFVKVRPELRQLITFRQINLHGTSWAVRVPVKVIFCRNVMIYFDAPSRRRILERFAAQLDPGGLLFLGHAENIADFGGVFRSLGQTAYMRTDCDA
ncbi:CheR family methyltransferase [Georgfuchsia toluolica]|nr:CheR family methyltransferase [Georgfuchsia toluolica]